MNRSADRHQHPHRLHPPTPAPLVVLSNRGPYVRRQIRGVERWSRTVGGLVSALDPAVRARGGRWVCAEEPGTQVAAPPEVTGYEIAPVAVTGKELEGYYNRVANGVLWPLLHSFPTRVRTQDAPWEVYRQVNRRFADAAVQASRHATYWVHDFQLLLAPGFLRERAPHARIGWFDHVPFPAPEIFAMLPERVEALEGLLGADLLGFQTPRDARNFLAAVAELTPHAVDYGSSRVTVRGRTVRVGAFPIGIDVDAVQVVAGDPDVHARRERWRASYGAARILVAVDRLDYTKGVPERLAAFAELLARHPELTQRVSLVQVAVPSRIGVGQYAQLKREVDELVGRINGKYARPGWTPVHYINRGLELDELVALYGIADVAVVTPLRDGMNLVAHEFAAARIDNAGVLVLSEFAGAATILDGAVLVNPYDVPRTTEALVRALEMPADEQEDRMRRLHAAVRRHRVGYWHEAFLSALESESPSAERSGRHARSA